MFFMDFEKLFTEPELTKFAEIEAEFERQEANPLPDQFKELPYDSKPAQFVRALHQVAIASYETAENGGYHQLLTACKKLFILEDFHTGYIRLTSEDMPPKAALETQSYFISKAIEGKEAPYDLDEWQEEDLGLFIDEVAEAYEETFCPEPPDWLKDLPSDSEPLKLYLKLSNQRKDTHEEAGQSWPSSRQLEAIAKMTMLLHFHSHLVISEAPENEAKKECLEDVRGIFNNDVFDLGFEPEPFYEEIEAAYGCIRIK
jgi:hypothetical protein